MTRSLKLMAVSALALMGVAGAAQAQNVLTGTRDIDERIDDLNRDINREINRGNDEYRFGNPEFRPGLSGSASLSYAGNTGSEESQELQIGARLRFAQGQVVQTIGVILDYSEDDDGATGQDIFAIYDANYFFNDSFYVFGLGRLTSDGLADGVDEDGITPAVEYTNDAFIGVGPGYRIFNNPNMTWRVQAGIGVSYLEPAVGDTETEFGAIASSRFFYAFSENVFMTNDTDFLNSDSAFRVNNDLGVNFKVGDQLSTRVSYLTDFNSSRDEEYENRLGLSLVYGF